MNRTEEEQLYAWAAQEIANGNTDLAIFSKAFVEALGDKQKTIAFYIKFRVKQWQDMLAEERKAKKVQHENIQPSSALQGFNYVIHLFGWILFLGLVGAFLKAWTK